MQTSLGPEQYVNQIFWTVNYNMDSKCFNRQKHWKIWIFVVRSSTCLAYCIEAVLQV